ncbi:MAG: 30S ribosomal protein S2 [Planctomycetales bacterium]|nr:30S ribosomal protein S2 [Planctomycetales bacterium]
MWRVVLSTLVKELVEAGVHFGHRASRWNPKMRPYIYARKDTIHIIDVRETIRGLLRAKKYLADVAARGSLILWVGTKRQAAESVEREAGRCGMPYVSERWLGGTLTNFRTIRDRLSHLEGMEAVRNSPDTLSTYSKKAQASLNREYKKVFRNLNGMRTMSRLPECLVVIDPKKEKNAVKEAQKLGIAVVSLIDTDCDPDTVDLPIPGNDDSMRSIEMIVKILADAVMAGKSQQAMQQQAASEGADKSASNGSAEPPADQPVAAASGDSSAE